MRTRFQRAAIALLTLAALGAFARGAPAPAPLGEVVGVWQAAFSSDASHVILCTRDGTVGLWDAASGAPLPGELNTAGPAFVMSADGRSVLVALKDGGARVFAMDSGAARSPQLDVRFRVSDHPEVVFSPEGSRVLIFEPDSAAVLDATSGQRLAKLPSGAGPADDDLEVAPSATFTEDGKRCLVMTAGGVVTSFDTATWKPLGPSMHHPAADSAYTFRFATSSDGRWVATFDDPGENGPKGHLQVWETAKNKPVGKPIVAVNGMTGAFLPASSRLLVTPGRGEASVRDLPSLRKSCTIPAHDDVDGPSVGVSPDGKWILSWGSDRIIRLQSAATGAVQESQAFQATISQVLMLPDSSGCLVVFDNSAFLLQNYYDHYVLKLSFPELKTLHSLRLTEPLNRAVLSPDGRRFLIQAGKTDNERVRIFETADLKPSKE